MPDNEPHSAPPAGSAAGGGRPQVILAFDFGRRRIGVACGDTVSRAANPLTGIVSTDSGPEWAHIAQLLREWQPNMLVVGLPYNADGSESAMSNAVRGFASELGRRFGLPVHLVDERYSSLEAQSRLQSQRESGQRRRRVAKADVDAAAACVILERWLTEST